METSPNGGPVRLVNPLEDSSWDDGLVGSPHPSFFHSSAWASVLHDVYGYTPVYFVVRDAGRFRCLLPIMEVDSWLTGRRGVSLPFTDDCDPVCTDPPAFHGLLEEAMRHAGARGWKYMECHGGRALWPGATASTCYYGHRLGLVDNEDVLFANVDGAVRRAIRKARKSGVTVEIAQDLAAVRTFYGLHCETRKKHGLPPQPFRFFHGIHQHILSRDRGFVVLARQGRMAVAGAVFFHIANKAIYKFGASDDRFQHLRANNLVMWEAIHWYATHGFDELDFGRTSLDNEGLRSFKLGWGTQERRIEYARYDRRRGGFVTVPDEAFGWHNRVFRALPGPVSRCVGAGLYRHVA
ncbi:MAG: GNAT family N-acetyltransferase [Verrucomicrobiia bacterium]